ncbi:phosphodiester glycosidase family protein [Polaromonas sp.]|nr:phosphodiester glycosidase family protein [Candidatus Saccharibacteria bacterium]
MIAKQIQTTSRSFIKTSTKVITLGDGKRTTIHIARYPRATTAIKLIAFDQPQKLSTWCSEQGIQEALSGGFFLRVTEQPLGDFWVDGHRLPSTPIAAEWAKQRGSAHISKSGYLRLGPRRAFPGRPDPSASLLQAGPLLVEDGSSLINDADSEGFRTASRQFDSDISDGRYPRAAIGYNQNTIFSLAVDGRSDDDAGMTLNELADAFIELGATCALNLDGGCSTSQISIGVFQNKSRGGGKEYKGGYPICNALVFQDISQSR